MSSVNYTLVNIKKDGTIRRYDHITPQKATVELINDTTIVVYVSGNYILGVAEVMEAFDSQPYPEYLVYDAWGHATEEAENLALQKGGKIVSYNRFRYIVKELSEE